MELRHWQWRFLRLLHAQVVPTIAFGVPHQVTVRAAGYIMILASEDAVACVLRGRRIPSSQTRYQLERFQFVFQQAKLVLSYGLECRNSLFQGQAVRSSVGSVGVHRDSYRALVGRDGAVCLTWVFWRGRCIGRLHSILHRDDKGARDAQGHLSVLSRR